MSDMWRGYKIEQDEYNCWRYSDTKELISDSPERECGHCKMSNTEEGHDGCLGILVGVNNACCGHGVVSAAYVQFRYGTRIQGVRARIVQKLNSRLIMILLQVLNLLNTKTSKPRHSLKSFQKQGKNTNKNDVLKSYSHKTVLKKHFLKTVLKKHFLKTIFRKHFLKTVF